MPTLAGGPSVDRMPGRLRGESLDRLGNPTFRLGLQSQEQSQEQPRKIQQHLKTQRKIAWKPKQKSRVSRPTTRVCLRNWRRLRRRRPCCQRRQATLNPGQLLYPKARTRSNWCRSHLVLLPLCTPRPLTATILSRRSRV